MTLGEFAYQAYQMDVQDDLVVVWDGDKVIYHGPIKILRSNEKERPFIDREIKVVFMCQNIDKTYTTAVKLL